MEEEIVAVVTGDVNASSQMNVNHARSLEQTLRVCFNTMRQTLKKHQLVGFTVFRGDSWQFAVRRPEYALHATLFFRAEWINRSYEVYGTRLQTSAAIGFGSIDYLPKGRSHAGGGDAFKSSGRRLDKIKRRQPGMGVAGLGELDSALDVLLGVVDSLARHWTPSQAKALTFAMQGMVQEEIARNWNPPITQQSVNKHLISAGWPAVEPALDWAKTAIIGCNPSNSL